MRLTHVLRVIFPKRKTYNGLVDQGKHAKPKQIKVSHKISTANDLAREAQNMIYLNTPYVTHDEQRLHGLHHYAEKQQARKEKTKQLRANRKFYPHRTLEEHLETLNINKKWE